ncbi:RHS repeat-associated core domain-containing protein [Herpetosiphon gulosus]|uniref:Teneurin-like YD-shell domain-containing protein n=1 Tax=Herpetosiphon gulosus TaxID=1973496 RepID=A0ABP9X775_9CHLR
MLNDGTATYTYDALGRLTSRTQGGTTSTHTYNGDGLLVASTTNGATTRFLWDTTASTAQLVGTQQASGTTWYVWSPMGGGTARVLYSLGPSGRRWLISDGIGSVRRTLSDSGTVIQARQWTPFGVEIGGTASAGLGYAGEWQDASGLVYLRARWYDPAASRFLSRDPWDGMISNPQTLNPYAYAHNQPTRFTDPSGRCLGPLMLFCIGAAVGAGMNFVSQFVQKGSLDAIDWTEVAVSGLVGGVSTQFPIVGAGIGILGSFLAMDAFMKNPNPVTGLNLSLSLFGACLGLGGLGGGGSGPALALAGGGVAPTAARVLTVNSAVQAGVAGMNLNVLMMNGGTSSGESQQNDLIIKKGEVNNYKEYEASAPNNPQLYAQGRIYNRDRILRLNFQTKGDDGSRYAGLRGKEQFHKIMQYFDGDFDIVRGSWVEKDNLAGFNNYLRSNPSASLEDAATNGTFTGQWLREYGYTNATILDAIVEGDEYSIVTVHFTK